jgi:PAS domain S-box-containing protein
MNESKQLAGTERNLKARLEELEKELEDRKRGDEVLRQTEQRLRLVLEANSEGVWDWHIPSGRAFFSRHYCNVLGYQPEEFATDYPSWRALVHPEDIERVERVLAEHLQQGGEYRVEFRMRKKSGDWCWIRSRGTIVERDAEGKPTRMIGTHLDITEPKRTQQALSESGERWDLLAKATGFGTFDYDFAARRASNSVEHLALYGLPPDGVLELDADLVPKALHPEDRPAFLASVQAANDPSGPGLFQLEFRIKRDDNGGLRWLSARGRTLFSSTPSGRRPVRAYAIVQDITERKLAEEALCRSYAEIKALKDRLQAETNYLRAEIKTSQAHNQIIGRSPGIKKVLHSVEQVAAADCAVLVSGETGTGKELIAQEIHRLSARKERVMVLVNCAALPIALVESELFGRERGAYTGALTSQIGRFEVANGSTIFLDEVGELSMEVQAKLLRVLQQGEFQRLGSPKSHKVDVRVIAATNRDLAAEVRKGRFREDLYYRLNVFPIQIPPLRERAEDIPLLVFAFMEEFATRMGKKITKIPRKAMEVLQGHGWPGNIRELRNVIEHSVILSAGDTLKLTILGEAPVRISEPVTLAEAEREHILKTLESTAWRIKGPHGAAVRLDMQPSTLYSRMQKLGIPHRRQKDEMAG